MYWAGSDVDGAVVGFYWAVVETLPLPIEGSPNVPPLPGPRTSQYQFTARTDSTFTFNVSEFRKDRQHAFFIYAVDDKGRADATPARFIFNALDRFPPLPIFDLAAVTGRVVRVITHGVSASKDTTIFVTDTNSPLRPVPRDTVPSGGRIDFRWHGLPTSPGAYAVKYKYKLDEPGYVEVDSSVHSVSYNTGINGDVVQPGTKVFNLKAIDASGGATDSTRRFQINFSPDSWFAGPEPNLVPVVTNDPLEPTNASHNLGHRYLTISNWRDLPTGSGSLLNCDSLHYWPSERKQTKTFWEIYKDKLFLRSQNDTIDMNSIVVLQMGGSDWDSPYSINVRNNHLPDTVGCTSEPARVLHPGPANGSPVGFRYQLAYALDPGASFISAPSPSALFPVFDAASSSEQPTVNGYKEFTQSGRVYLIVRAVDGDAGNLALDTGVDRRLEDAYSARLLADEVDGGGGTLNQKKLREQLILTFYVNRAPYFDFSQALFFPKPPEFNGGAVAVSPDRVLHLNLAGVDPDPYDPVSRPPPGGPSTTTVLRTQVTVSGTGQYAPGGALHDTSFTALRQYTSAYTIDLHTDAPYITSTRVYVTIELCDCANCEQTSGTGRCITSAPIPVDLPPPAASSMGDNTLSRPTGTKPRVTSSRSLTP